MTEELHIEKTVLPPGWLSTEVDTLCEVEYGTRVVRKRDGGTIYPVYGGGGATFFMDTFNRENCLVVARFAMSKKCTRFINGKFFLNDSGLSVKPRNTDLISQKFLNKYFIFLNDYIYSLARGTAQKNLNVPAFRKLLISYPKSTHQQQQIVATLDKAFAAIDKAKANAEQNLKNAKELFESYLQNVFENKGDNWVSSELNEFVNFIDYRGRTPVKTSSGVRLITAKNIKLGYLQIKPEEFIAEDNYEAWMTRGIPNFGDVIFTTEAPLGHIAQVNTKEKLAFAQRVIVMQPDAKKINQTFLKYLLLSNPIRNKILARGTGATVLGIKSRLLKKIEIDFPNSIEEQEKIVIKLDTLSEETKKIEAIYTLKIADLEEMKKSVLQKAFSGQLNTVT